LNSLSGFALTRLDILSGLKTLKVAVSYCLDGEEIRHIPTDIGDFGRVVPNLVEMEGWSEDLSSMRSFGELPEAAKAYVRFVEEQTGTPVAMIGVGPDREQTIVVRPELVWA
ncbi:MAG TPA: adenylosuccinate synthetase, partial [Fimbriimonadaceae bacterium]|nr:adenylosuccinate synthetase [Fimbriimonadaceae bacterium]